MKKLVLALALVAGTMLIGGSPASATDGQFETNHTVSVPAGETVTYVRSCEESSSHPEGGTAVDGRATFNETNSADFMEVVSEGITEDGTGYFTTVKNNADRDYAYLSWAVCDPIPVVEEPVFDSYDVTVCWAMHGEANEQGYSWPQTRLANCDPVPKCEETIAIQEDVYSIDSAEDEAYLAGLQTMESSKDDQRIIKSYLPARTVTGDECEVVEPPVDEEPVVVPPVDDEEPPAVTPPVVKVETPPAKVEVVTPPAEVTVKAAPKVVKLVTTPAPVVTHEVAQPVVQEQGVLPNTGGPDALYITAGAILLAMGSTVLLLARKDRRTN